MTVDGIYAMFGIPDIYLLLTVRTHTEVDAWHEIDTKKRAAILYISIGTSSGWPPRR
jgi:hypothetical protein